MCQNKTDGSCGNNCTCSQALEEVTELVAPTEPTEETGGCGGHCGCANK